VKEALRVKEKRIFRKKEVDFPAAEALVDPDLSEHLERGGPHTLGRAYLSGDIRIHIRAKWASPAQGAEVSLNIRVARADSKYLQGSTP
jgi:hypothetical protein